MKDRVPGAPGQYTASVATGEFAKLENGKPFSITLMRDDQPLVEGTPYSKAAVLPDEVAAALCPGVEDPTPADAFKALADRTKAKAGFIYPLASETVPEGFLLCDGAAYSRTQYAELFEAIGTTYGTGDGNTTFNVPNLSTRVPVGTGDGYDLGATGGAAEHTLKEAEMPSHYHKTSEAIYGDSNWTGTQSGEYAMHHYQSHTVSGSTHVTWQSGIDTGETGGGQPHNNMQPYTVVNYIIATGKGDDVGYVVAGTASGGGGETGEHPVIVTDFGEYTTLADFIQNGMEDNSAVICYTDSKLSDFPDTTAIAYYSTFMWCVEIHKSSSSVAEITARGSNRYAANQTYTHRWNGMYNGYNIDWEQVQLYTGASEIDDSVTSAEKTWSSQKIESEITNALSGAGGGDAWVVAQGTSNDWLWRKWSNGFAECWTTTSLRYDSSGTGVLIGSSMLPFYILANKHIQATHLRPAGTFASPTTELGDLYVGFAPIDNYILIYNKRTEAYSETDTAQVSVYVCGTYE